MKQSLPPLKREGRTSSCEDPRLDLFDVSPAELGRRLGGPNRGVLPWKLIRQGRSPFSPGELGPKALERFTAVCRETPIEVIKRSLSACGTRKLLLRMEDGLEVETVVIPGPERSTVCVSSQVGCVRGCEFCVTATMGLIRNLRCAEIVAQVHFARLEAQRCSMPPLRNIVFMGMGEPLDNLSEVRKSLELLVDPQGMGFGPRYVTVSTVGPSPRAVRLMRSLPARVAWSVHAVDEAVRKRLVPVGSHSMEELREAFLEVMRAQKDSLFVEITLIDGQNDSLLDAQRLGAFLRVFPGLVRINLLPVNPGRPGMVPSPPDKVEAFRAYLQEAGYFCMVRRPRGQESMAACGQLAVETLSVGRRKKKRFEGGRGGYSLASPKVAPMLAINSSEDIR